MERASSNISSIMLNNTMVSNIMEEVVSIIVPVEDIIVPEVEVEDHITRIIVEDITTTTPEVRAAEEAQGIM